MYYIVKRKALNLKSRAIKSTSAQWGWLWGNSRCDGGLRWRLLISSTNLANSAERLRLGYITRQTGLVCVNFCNTFAGLCQKATLAFWLNSTVSFVDMFALSVGTKVGSWVKFFAKPLLRRMSSSPSVFEVKWGAAVACSNCHLGASKLCTLPYSLFAQKIQVSENRVSHYTK